MSHRKQSALHISLIKIMENTIFVIIYSAVYSSLAVSFASDFFFCIFWVSRGLSHDPVVYWVISGSSSFCLSVCCAVVSSFQTNKVSRLGLKLAKEYLVYLPKNNKIFKYSQHLLKLRLQY